MGKKKAVKKTKELSVAIAESSSLDAEGQQQPLSSPRKRGRPRKIIVEKTEVEEVKEEEETAKEEGHDVQAGGDRKKVKISDEKEEGQASNMKEEATTSSSLSSKNQLPSPSSRARRKSKPRKSS